MSNKKSEAPNGRNGGLKIYFMAFKRFCSDIKIKLFFEFYILYSRSKWSCLNHYLINQWGENSTKLTCWCRKGVSPL